MTRRTLGLAVLITVAVAAGYAGWRVYRSSQVSVCQVCGRPLHGVNRTVAALNDGEPEAFCCPTCALNAARQRRQSIRFVEVTDYVSQRALDPAKAFLVRGSNVNPCMEHHSGGPMMDESGQPMPLEFDRCAPSILAFSGASAARDFAEHHGGEPVTLDQLTAELP